MLKILTKDVSVVAEEGIRPGFGLGLLTKLTALITFIGLMFYVLLAFVFSVPNKQAESYAGGLIAVVFFMLVIMNSLGVTSLARRK